MVYVGLSFLILDGLCCQVVLKLSGKIRSRGL